MSNKAPTGYGSIQADEAAQSPTDGPLIPPAQRSLKLDIPTPKDGSTVVGWDVLAYPSTNSYPLLFRAAPWRLLVRDFYFLARHSMLVPKMFLPIKKGKDIAPIALLGQIVYLALSLVVTVALAAGAIVGFPPFVLALLLLLLFAKGAEWTQGAKVRDSKGTNVIPSADKEAWFFVNGVSTTGLGAQANATRIQTLFHRPVTAVLNRSLGLWFDLVECILQRDLLYITKDIRVGYKAIRKAVLDSSKERIVIIAHSQGGIIASAWADQLICDFPTHLLTRVEFYTFASAANHFSRPAKDRDGTDQPFAHVEHFANENDFVSRFGVLGHAPAPNEADEGDDPLPRTSPISAKLDAARDLPHARGDYAGRIFCRRDHTGHQFMSHYLHEDNCILEDPYVREYSHLVTYLNGGGAL